MKQRDLKKIIASAARSQGKSWELLREGKKHEVWTLDRVRIPIPRHREVSEATTRDILSECEEVLGKDWWK